MKQMINTTDYAFDVERYRDEQMLFRCRGMDGFELLLCERKRWLQLQNDRLAYICDVLIPGWISGMENWNVEQRIPDPPQKLKEIFGGLDRSCILKRFRKTWARYLKLCGLSCKAMSVPRHLPISAGTERRK